MITIYDVLDKAENGEYGNSNYNAEFQQDLYNAIKNKLQYRDEVINKDRAATVIYNKAWETNHSEGWESVVKEADDLIEFIGRVFR